MELKPIYPYTLQIEKLMKVFYASLNEKDKRHYAALEAEKLCYGGISYIAELFGCVGATVQEGLEEFKKMICLIQEKYLMKAVEGNNR